MKITNYISVFTLALVMAVSAFGAGTKEFGAFKDHDDVVTNAWENMSSKLDSNGAWAKGFSMSNTFKQGVTNALHRKIAMLIIPVNDVALKAPYFVTNTQYLVGDRIYRDHVVYRCDEAITAAENTNWEVVSNKFIAFERPIIYKGFELKASIDNFAHTTFYSQSENADVALLHDNDKMRLYVESYHVETDGRKYHEITNTLTGWNPNNTLVNVTVLIDTTCLARTPETSNPEWLYENNKDLFWTYVRTKDAGHEEEIMTDTSYKCLWRPIMPVKWFSTWPNWAE